MEPCVGGELGELDTVEADAPVIGRSAERVELAIEGHVFLDAFVGGLEARACRHRERERRGDEQRAQERAERHEDLVARESRPRAQ